MVTWNQWLGEMEIDWKGHKETFLCDENVLCFDCGDCYIGVYIGQTYQSVCVKCVHLLYTNYALIKLV